MNSLILASSSPRRAELLKQLGFSFTIHFQDYDESIPSNITPSDAALYIAKKKISQIDLQKNSTYITADTTVIFNNKVLGKPQSRKQAIEMISNLSGNTHRVITGVCIANYQKQSSINCITEVTFKHLRKEDILYYVEKYNPLDKAGAYGIQEWIGMIGVKEIKGSYYNVVGLPTEQVYEKLLEFGF